MRAVIRWINESNAASLGYGPGGYVDGAWVLETHGDVWETNLTDVPQTRVDVAERAAEAVLGSAPAFWRKLPDNYGTAYETEIEDK